MARKMMSEIGNKKSGFTLIEVLLAVAIFSIGIAGILVSYVHLLDALRLSQETICANYLLKEVMIQVEEESLEGPGLLEGVKEGNFGAPYLDYRWIREITASGEVGLNQIKVVVFNKRHRERKLSINSYVESKKKI
ncbi:MAG: type II secretion system protein [Candidatus Omnitrophota bacterium]